MHAFTFHSLLPQSSDPSKKSILPLSSDFCHLFYGGYELINSYYDYDSTYNVIEYWLQNSCIISSNNLQAKSKNKSLFWSRILLWLGNEKLYFPTLINVLMFYFDEYINVGLFTYHHGKL